VRKFIFLLLLIFCNPLVFAGEVISNVRGQVLINTYGEKFKLNQKLYIYNPKTQRKIGVVQVMQKRRDQEAVMAELLNGKAPPGALAEIAERNISNVDEVDIREHRTRANELERRTKRESSGNLRIKHGFGLSLMNSQLSVKTSYVKTNMTGSGLGVDYNFQVPVTIQTSFLGAIGFHPIKLNHNSTTGNNDFFDVSYLSLVGLAKYIFNPNQTGMWLGAGGGLIVPNSKSSSVLQSDSITTNYSLNFVVGTDMASRKQLISLSFGYAIFPGSNTPTTSTSFSQTLLGFSYYF
jgi:hypothetical protein